MKKHKGCSSAVACLAAAVLPVLALAQRVEVPRQLVSYPELIVHNAQILTVDDDSFTSRLGTVAQAMAIRERKILAVGRDTEILELKGPSTKVIDLKGRIVMPGMINTHDHPYHWVLMHEAVYKKVIPDDVVVTRFLNGPVDEQFQKFEATLKEAVAKARPGQWVYIVFDEGPRQDDRGVINSWLRRDSSQQMMDQLAPNNPVAAGAVLGTYLNIQGVEEYMKVYPNWENYTVAEQEGAENFRRFRVLGEYPKRRFFWDVMLRDHLAVATELVRQELSWFAGYGNTTIASTFEGYNAMTVHAQLEREGKLPVRLAWGYSGPIFDDPFFLRSLAAQIGKGSDTFWLISAVPETVLGSCTTFPTRTPEAKARERCVLAPGMPARQKLYNLVKAGVRIGTLHTGGDLDIQYLLEIIVQASKDAGMTPEEIRAKRHAFDHCFLAPRPDQIPLIKQLGIILSCSDNQIWESMLQNVQNYGERAATMMTPRRSLTEAGIFHTLELDEPLGSLDYNGFFFYWQGTTRKAPDGQVYGPAERIGREIMIKAATTWASQYVLREDVLGSLEPGKFADFIVLNHDLLKVPEEELSDVRVLMTVVGGQVKHLAPPLARELGLSATGAQVELGPPRGQTSW
ncbi:MAG: amidohydrolase family protein [Acidobacteria bacterium]|nr:amidohydrolase family protein [Acidobacteriota bacterium]